MAQRVEIPVTQGNLNNSHLYLRRHLDFLPSDALGAGNVDDGRGRRLTIYFQGLAEPVETDIAGGNKLFLRDRGSWGRFYALHRLRDGDSVTVERIGDYEYVVSPLPTRAEEQVAAGGCAREVPGSPPVPTVSASAGGFGRFAEFRAHIAALRPPIADSEALRREFLVDREGPLEIYYAPMEFVRAAAKVAIVGITPGKQTMKIALETAAAGLHANEPEEAFLDRVKSRASFSGMRTQLVSWLDELDLHTHLGLASSAELWSARGEHLLQPTSSIRYPVLKSGANYSGSGPTIVQSPMLRGYVERVLSQELGQLPEALIVPLGKRVDEGLSWLAARGVVDSRRILCGFPHPSGANGHRHRQWAENADTLRRQTARWFA